MKKFLSNLFRFNGIWIVIFFAFQILTIFLFDKDGKYNNKPYTLNEYLVKGGNKFDYYTGYAFLTTNDTYNIHKSDKMRLSVIDKTYLRYIYILLYVAIWIYGFYGLSRIQIYYFPTEEDLKRAKKAKKQLVKPGRRHYVFGIITTAISLYGIYYTFVYVINFWLH